MSVPLAQLIRMTRFLLLYEMFEEVVVYSKIAVVKIQKLLKTGCEYV